MKIPYINRSLLVLLLIIVSASIMYLISGYPKKNIVGCTLEAKICLDGSTVSRIGPNCEFAPCPTIKLKQTITPSSPLTDKYQCPETEWINCMPTVGSAGKIKPECRSEYLKWAKENCPNFKGAAY